MARPKFSSPWLWVLLAGGAAAAAALVAIAPWQGADPSPPTLAPRGAPADPRLNYSGPYLNVHPDVKYVGDSACVDCHDQHETFRHHPMGRSAQAMRDFDQRAMEAAKHNNPLTALGSELRIDREGDRVWQREVRRDAAGQAIVVNSFELHYVIGSGNHGHSYLTDRDGYIFQTPISWYSAKDIWDLAPGWTNVGGGRAILKECLFCHTNRVEPVEDSLNRYRQPLFGHQATIGCERCHGPGEKHVARWSAKTVDIKGPDFSIVNPAKLTVDLREAVCQQCHLEGEYRLVRRGRGLFDFRPGMPLGQFWNVFVHAEGDNPNAVNHVEQMRLSGCFKGTAGKSNQLTCVSCHDPHVKPRGEERVTHFRASCQKCHEESGCSVPEPERRKQNAKDSCIDCHMPRKLTADIAHTASSDHRIVRRPKPLVARHASGTGPAVRSFFAGPSKPATPEDHRDLGVVLARLAHQGTIEAVNAREAIALLDAHLGSSPDDVEAWDAKAQTLQAMARPREAAVAYGEALNRAPNREPTVAGAARLATTMKQHDEAIRLWRRAVELNPWQPEYHGNLALLLQAKSDWPGVRAHADATLRLDPVNIEARVLRIEALLQAGDKAAAQSEFRTVEALKPSNLEALRTRFRERLTR